MQSHVLQHVRGADDRTLKVRERVGDGEGDRSAPGAMNDGGWLSGETLKSLDRHIGWVPGGEPPGLPFIREPISVADARDRMTILGEKASNMATEKAVRTCYQSVALFV